MNICIDVGNTTTVIGVFENDSLIERLSITTDTTKTEDEYRFLINQQFNYRHIDVSKTNNIIYSSVVPELNNSLLDAFKSIFKKNILTITPGIKTGLSIKVDNPNEIGNDLIADLVATKEIVGYPTIIVDLGTASKLLLLDKNGAFSACLITPGISLSAKSLSSKASLLPTISLETPKTIMAKNTIDAMTAGIVYGHTDMIKGLVKRLEESLGYKCKKVLTGGGADRLKPLLGEEYILENDLNLVGLNILLKKNEAKHEK